MEDSLYLIGLTGTNGSGKGTLAAALEGAGYVLLSLSDLLRAELAHRGVEETVNALADLGNALRAERGGDCLARDAYEAIQTMGVDRAIVDSIRTLPEVRYFRDKPRFLLVAVDAPIELRYERVMGRNRPGDRVDLDQFIAQEERQLSGGETEQNLLACMKEADILLSNEGSEESLVLDLKRELQTRGIPWDSEQRK